jgi:hypothetical protein
VYPQYNNNIKKEQNLNFSLKKERRYNGKNSTKLRVGF